MTAKHLFPCSRDILRPERAKAGVSSCPPTDKPSFTAGKKGFTLLEMIVVLVLLGVTMGLFLGFNFRQMESLRLRAAGRDMYQFLRGARSAAMIEDMPNVCLYYPQNATLGEGLRRRQMALPPGVRILLEEEPEDDTAPLALTTFYPDGTAVMNTIVLGVKERRLAVTVRPILGQVIIEAHPDDDEDQKS